MQYRKPITSCWRASQNNSPEIFVLLTFRLQTILIQPAWGFGTLLTTSFSLKKRTLLTFYVHQNQELVSQVRVCSRKALSVKTRKTFFPLRKNFLCVARERKIHCVVTNLSIWYSGHDVALQFYCHLWQRKQKFTHKKCFIRWKKSKMKEQKGRASEEINLSALLPAWMEWIMKFNKANKNGKALCVRLGWARSKMRTGGMERKARKATQFRLVFLSFCLCEKGRRLTEGKQDT